MFMRQRFITIYFIGSLSSWHNVFFKLILEWFYAFIVEECIVQWGASCSISGDCKNSTCGLSTFALSSDWASSLLPAEMGAMRRIFFMCEWRYWTCFHRWRPYKVNLKLQLGLSCIWMCELESAGLSSASLFPQLPTFGLCHEPISDSQIGPFQMKLNWKMLSRSTPKAAKGQPVALNEW